VQDLSEDEADEFQPNQRMRPETRMEEGTMRIRKLGMSICMAAGSLVLIATAFPQATTDQGEGNAILTILPKNDMKAPVNILQHDLRFKVNGKQASITGWVPLRGSNWDLEPVILIDDSARDSLRRQFGEIALFIEHLPLM
jgi:hypothetical protein